ncbi:MAG TPA: TerB N-terminal domain-containing protein [Chthoniobacterales bacterium]|nr:TerB N-terminal domain-containing protein [Chthoniobacterales bacterium]
MSFLVVLLCAGFGAVIGGVQGAIIGGVIGIVIASSASKKGSNKANSGGRVASAHNGSKRATPPPLPATLKSSLKSADGPLGKIGVSVAFGHESIAQGLAKLNWSPSGKSLNHAGVIISDGMVYTSERRLTWPGEPSAIIKSLPVGNVPASPLQDFGYWPSYDRITPEQRRCYLEWLSAGRKDTDPTQRSLGYVFLFFYGLERRIVVDADRDPMLLDEVLRLLQHYGSAHKSRSLRSYFLQLLHFGGWRLGSGAYRDLWPRLLALDVDRPDPEGLRFVLANLCQRQEALDWTVAYRLAFSDQQSRRSTVVARTQEKFFALFRQRFNEAFSGGLLLQAAKQEGRVEYRPASNSLAQMRYGSAPGDSFAVRLPNVIGLHSQFKTLPEIWNSCVDDLSGYSRALASKRQGQAAALLAWQSLPRELRRVEDHPLKSAFEELLASAPHEGDYIFVPAATLTSLAGIPERTNLTIAQSRLLVRLVEELGWQLAPNPDITGLPLAWNQELALSPITREERVPESLPGLMRLLYLSIMLAAADGIVETEELAVFYEIVASQIPDESEWSLLRAAEACLRRDTNIALRLLPQISKLVPAESRQFVLRTLAHVAAADGEVTLDELRALRRISRSFQLDADAAEKVLREDEAFREVAIAPGKRGSARGEPIPTRNVRKPASFALNQDRIKILTEETHEVISLLSSVMAEPETTSTSPIIVSRSQEPSLESVEWLSSLEERYHAAVLELVRHDQITTADFDRLAADQHLLPDDLFNAVNAWSDETLGDFLLERGANIRIYRSLVPEPAALSVAA